MHPRRFGVLLVVTNLAVVVFFFLGGGRGGRGGIFSCPRALLANSSAQGPKRVDPSCVEPSENPTLQLQIEIN